MWRPDVLGINRNFARQLIKADKITEIPALTDLAEHSDERSVEIIPL